MKLSRALELCQQPLDASRSQLVRVERYALIHVLRDRAENVENLKKARDDLASTGDELVKANQELELLNYLPKEVIEQAKAKQDEAKALEVT